MTFMYAAVITPLSSVIAMLTLFIVSLGANLPVLSMFIVNEPLCVKTSHYVIDDCYV